MQQMLGAAPRIFAIALIAIILSTSIAAFPLEAFAEVSSVQTQQLLPPGANTCAPLSAYGFTPYVYEGALHSFEFTVPDASYVALTGTAGDTLIPFQFMTRSGSANALRVHVDMATTPIHGTLPLSVTLLSAEGGPVCMSVVIMNVVNAAGSGTSAPAAVSQSGSGAGVSDRPSLPPPSSAGGVALGVTPTATSTDSAPDVLDTPAKIGPPASTSLDENAGALTATIGSIQNRVVESCLSGASSRLWIILVAMYAVIVAVALFVRPPSSWDYSVSQRAVTILVPLILLAGFWYFAEACRVSPWAWPLLVSILVALLGLAWLYRDHEIVRPYVLKMKRYWKDMQNKWPTDGGSSSGPNAPMITPPPSEKKRGSEIGY